MKELYLLFIIVLIKFIECNASREPIENPKYFEGDIRLKSWQRTLMLKYKTVGYSVSNRPKWDKIIPYSIEMTFGKNVFATNIIRSALNEIEERTCLRFIKRTTEVDYLHFVQRKGCFAHVGRQIGRNLISLGYQCLRKGYIHHEVGHALGFYHEQSRPDRDRYVKIVWKNIKLNDRRNFEILPSQISHSDGSQYDYDSVMHYSSTAFNDNNRITIQTTDLKDIYRIGQRRGFSITDYAQLNKMYNCIVAPPTTPIVTTLAPTHPPATFSKPNTVFICESTSRLISCGTDSIYIILSYFGRETWSICPAVKTTTQVFCHAMDGLAVVRKACDGKNYCWMNADPGYFTPDPCRGTSKYLRIDYFCQS